MRLLVSSVRDYAIFMLDAEGRIESWNAGAEIQMGWTAEEIVGRHHSVFYLVEDVAKGKPQALLAEAATAERIEDEGWRVRKDGSRYWSDVVITAVRDSSGAILGYAKVSRDLSERRRNEELLRQSEERMRLLIDGVRDYAIFLLDVDGCVATWNRNAERITGWRGDEILGEPASRFYSEEDVRSGKWHEELEISKRIGRYEDEGWRVRKDGTRFWAGVILTALADEDGDLVGFAKVTRDLTERRKLEEERLRRGQAEEAIRLRDEFLSIASHELKTPLTALQLRLQSMQSRVVEMDGAVGTAIGQAIKSTRRLADLVETLLDVSRISTGRLTLRPERVDLAEVAHGVVDAMQDAAKNAGCEVTVRIEDHPIGLWDRLRVEQLLTNFLSNAVKYGAGSPVDVTIASEGTKALIEVRDRGPGIAPADAERIFERFERAASMRHYGGLGLGLYVAQEIARAHRGSVGVRNAPDRGAIFDAKLPIAPSEGGGKPTLRQEHNP